MGGIRRKDKPERDDVSAKIDRKICEQAKTVAVARGIPVAEYLSEILRPIVQRDRWALGDELVSDRPEGGKPGKKPDGDKPPGEKPGGDEPGSPPGGTSSASAPQWINPNPGPSEPPEGVVPPKARKRDRPENRRGNAR